MPLKTTEDFVESLQAYMEDSSSCLLDRQVPFPRWVPPDALKDGTFEKKAEQLYRQEITKKKSEQDAEKLVNLGNDYYFSLVVKKSHNILRRGRISAVAAGASLGKTCAPFLRMYRQLGDKADPNGV
jgi:hypothetical protein